MISHIAIYHILDLFCVKVNEQDMTGLNHREAIEFLRTTPRKVTLRLQRGSAIDSDDMTHGEKKVFQNELRLIITRNGYRKPIGLVNEL